MLLKHEYVCEQKSLFNKGRVLLLFVCNFQRALANNG